MRVPVLVLLAMGGAWGCAHTNLEIQAHRLPNGRIQYMGPLAGPYGDFRKLAEAVCETISTQPGVTNGSHHWGYCAPYFYSPEAHGFFISDFADAEGASDSPEKACTFAGSPPGLNNRATLLLGGAYTITGKESPTTASASAGALWRPTMFSDQSAREPWAQDVLVFVLEGRGACSIYEYNSLRRLVSIRHGNAWRPFAEVSNEQGIVKVLENGQ
jgi:hypothetical protein